MNLLTRVSVFAALLLVGVYSAQAQFSLSVGTRSRTVTPGGVAAFDVTVTNNSPFDINLRVLRTKNELPENSGWASSLCSGLQCYPPDMDTIPAITMKPDGSMIIKLTIQAELDIEAVANVALQFDTGDDTPAQTLEFSMTATSGTSSVHPQLSPLAVNTVFPNPSNGAVRFGYRLATSATPRIDVSSISGERVLSIESGYQTAGDHAVDLDLSSLPNGVYVVTVVAKDGENSTLVTLAR